MAGLLVTSDLMFASRITAAAKPLGAEIRVAKAADAAAIASEQLFNLIMVDLVQVKPASLPALVDELKRSVPPPHIVAYGPHVDEATLESAKDAGCDEVLTRGQFHQRMGDLIAAWLPTD